MPRGRPPKQKVEEAEKPNPELQKAIQEESQPVIEIKPTRKKTITQVAKWMEEEPIEEEETEEEESDIPEEFEEEAESQGIFEDFLQPGAEGHFIKVWKLPSWRKDQKTGLRNTNRQFCDDLPLTPDYMQIIKSTWGAGVYQLELRDERSRIVKNSRRMTIEIATPNLPPVTQVQTLPNGQQVPIIIEQPQQQPPSPPPSLKHQLKDLAEVAGIIDMIRGEKAEPIQTQAAPLDPDLAALSVALKNPDAMERVTSRLGSLLFKGAGDKGEVTFWDFAMEAVKSGQLAQTAGVIMNAIMEPFKTALNGGNNGTSQMGAPSLAHQGQSQIQQQPQIQTDSNQGVLGQAEINETPSQVLQPGNSQSPPTPEIQALRMLIDHCGQNLPPQVAAERLLAFEKAVEQQAPQYSISGYIDLLVHLDPEAAFAITNQVLPGSESITSLPHAKGWFEQLQVNLKGNQESEGEEDET